MTLDTTIDTAVELAQTAGADQSDMIMKLGIVAIVAGVVMLIIAAYLISRAMNRAQSAPEAQPAPAVTFAPAAAQAAQAEDGQLVAVITAALMAYQGAAAGGKQLVVRSVRRAPGASAWASAGRQEQINY